MAKDHLDRETSVSVALTESGVQAKAKSRVIAAIDRLGGNLVELINAPMEKAVSRQRAISEAEVKLIEATARFGVEQFERDPEFARRAAEKYFEKIFIQQENKDAVLRHALDDLRQDSPSAAEAAAGDDQLDNEFIGRFEKYAEGASTEQLRQKWGKILSAEVRKPGTFSSKVLRVVDEIEPPVAQSFEQLCVSQLNNVLPKCLVGKLPFQQLISLTAAGLLIDPGLTGHVYKFVETKDDSGLELWFTNLGDVGAAFPKNTKLPVADDLAPLTETDGAPGIPVYLLTDAGIAVAKILPNHTKNAFARFIERMKVALPSTQIREYDKSPSDDQFVLRSTQSWQTFSGYNQTVSYN